MLRILHLSDLHLKNASFDQKIVVDAVLRDVRETSANGQIDIVVFSGDLAVKGSSPELFEAAKDKFIVPMMDACKLDLSRFYIVPGNHDVSKEEVEDNPYLESGLASSLSSLESVNKFIEETIKGTPVSLQAFSRLNNYRSFERSLTTSTPKLDLPTVRTFETTSRDFKIGLACFNTAWRCTAAPNDADKGKLILGERSVDLAIESLKDTDFTFAIFHHPLEYLASFEANAVESRLLVGFDMLLYGHVHAAKPMINRSPLGRAFFSQSGCLFHSRRHYNGYQIIEIDEQSRAGRLYGRTYFDQPREFRAAVNVLDKNGEFEFSIPDKALDLSHIDRALMAIKPIIRAKANRHVTIALDPNAPLDDIYKVFVCPPMRFGQRTRKIISDAVGSSVEASIDTILTSNENLLISGGRETGKTSLAHYICSRYAEGLGDAARIPILLDARVIKTGEYNLRQGVRAYFSDDKITGATIWDAVQTFPNLIIIDNFDEKIERHIYTLKELLERKNVRIICISRTASGNDFVGSSKKDPLDRFREIQIDYLPRRAIRQLSANRAALEKDDSNQIFSSVMANLVSAQLPWNGYMVSLLLWAHAQNKEFVRLNEAVLIEMMVNFLLEKGEFTGAFRDSFDSRSKEILLQALAVFFTDSGDTISEKALYDFAFDFFSKKRLNFSVPETIGKLIEVGILSVESGLASFRYRCFQEYFFACAMKEQPDLYEKVSKLDKIALYAREIDLFTSSLRKNFGFLEKALEWIQSILPAEGMVLDGDLGSTVFHGTGHIGLSPSRRRALKKAPLENEQIDEALEKAEQLALRNRAGTRETILAAQTSDEKRPDFLAPELFLAIETLGRIIRNSEFDDVGEKIFGLEFYIEHFQNLVMTVFSLFTDAINLILENREEFSAEITREDLENISNVLKLWFPLGLTSQIAEQAGSEKLIPVIKDVLSERSTKFGKVFFLTSLLFDLRAEGSIKSMYALAKKHDDAYRRYLIHEKLCSNYNMRRYREEDRIELENAIADIELLLGAEKSKKGSLITERRNASERLDA